VRVLKPTFRDALAAADGALIGLWNASGSPVAAELMAGSGADLLLVDGEHGPMDLRDLLQILQSAEAYPVTTLVRIPWNDPVRIKQVLDLGAQNILVPMVSTVADAEAAVRAARYPGSAGERAGTRGIGSALARSARWGRATGYVAGADAHVSVTVQIETADAVANAAEIAAVDGVDALFIGPADLAGSMGYPGRPSEQAVVDAVDATIDAVRAAGKPVGVNAFADADQDRVLARGADFVFVAADVSLMARGSEAAVARLKQSRTGSDSY
jgi:4-hydroxy-2-oxoheptanedioate aldolase